MNELKKLLSQAVLNENNYGDNISATIDIKTWRQVWEEIKRIEDENDRD